MEDFDDIAEIERLNHVIENKTNDIENFIDMVETSNKELYNLKNKVFNNEKYILCDILKLSSDIKNLHQELDYSGLIDIIQKIE